MTSSSVAPRTSPSRKSLALKLRRSLKWPNLLPYLVLAVLSVLAYAFLVGGAGLLLGQAIQPTNPYLIGLMAFLLATLFHPLYSRLQSLIQRHLSPQGMLSNQRQQALIQELSRCATKADMLTVLRRFLQEVFDPLLLHLFTYEALSGQYLAAPDEQGLATTDLRFSPSGALASFFAKNHQALVLSPQTPLPEDLQPDENRLRLLAAVLLVPLYARERLIGWIALGERRNGAPYTPREIETLDHLGHTVGLVLEGAQTLSELERRIREMNVLTRVAQGISFTVTFDDLLELIAAQTNQVLPARDLRIALVDAASGDISYAFCLEDDERYRERENRPLNPRQGLEGEVIRTQRPLVTNDYEGECRRRGLQPDTKGLYAWLGVPLNAGAETIGALSVGSRDPNFSYTEEQRYLLQAIADQTSGAILKARALEEAERRARQLAKLNEIGISLTSTLEVKPLLRQVLASAVEILQCQAGSLFLVDEESGELVFEVVLGPVADELVGQRLPPGAGLAGKAAQSGQAIIANDAKRRKEWFSETDAQTGFDTQDILVVPMRFQERVIGVIEVINKLNGAPFTQADQELLTAFASQATIALENARLYTLTDQALSERVEELSMMQRIDRELNASLDIEHAMRLTLDWALRQSRWEAGFVGTVQDDRVQVVVAQGYPPQSFGTAEKADSKPAFSVSRAPALEEAIKQGQMAYRVADPASTDVGGSFLAQARQQLVVPIRREQQTIGVLVLESAHRERLTAERIAFLTRLSDHAAIAIANARLYEEVKEANLAKSRFVSFVAHELKNPMASIKGYTELVASGMAGPINEMQAGFLATVRSNVDRMNTIVSDLNDLTKIQVGNLRLDFRAVAFGEVIQDVVRSLQRQIEEKEQHLTLAIAPDLPPLWADASRLAQILTNLISNAHKYTPPGGTIAVHAEIYHNPQESEGGPTFVHFWVEDNGIGISEEDHPKVFQQYFRAESAKEMAGGTGLGLAITRSLVELQGGKIWFESQLGKGSVFHVTLPTAELQ